MKRVVDALAEFLRLEAADGGSDLV